MTKTPLTVEQMCRDLLTQAIRGGLVEMAYHSDDAHLDPQARPSGEMCGMANLLAKFLASEKRGE